MKRLSCSVILIFVLQTFVHGQSSDNFRRWHFGVMAGPHFITYVPKSPYFKAVTGFMAGADIGYNLQNSQKGWSLNLQPYFMANRSSSETGTKGTESYSESKSKTRTVNLPLTVRYTITGGKVRPFAEIGAVWTALNRWSFKSRSMICKDGGCYDLIGDWAHGNVKGHRFSALAAAGVQIDVGKVTIPITVRVLQLLKKQERVFDPFSGTDYTIPTVRSMQVTAGMAF